MERIEPDQTPSQAWKANLDATCNRLMSHYLSLLRAGTSDAVEGDDHDGAADDLGRDSRGWCERAAAAVVISSISIQTSNLTFLYSYI
jgi:hypothetical protein